MISPEARLSNYFSTELPPARDTVFQAGVLEAVARRAFHREMMALSVVSAFGGGLLWLMWPILHPTLGVMARGLAPGAIWVGVAVSIIALTSRPMMGYRT